MGAVCLSDEGLGFAGYDSLMATNVQIIDEDPHGGGEIVPAQFELGAPIRVRYYIQNLGKIARIKAQIWVGETMANQWGYIFGDVARSSQPTERQFSVGGGVLGISPDLAAKDHYILRIISPLNSQGGVPLEEARNDARAIQRQEHPPAN